MTLLGRGKRNNQRDFRQSLRDVSMVWLLTSREKRQRFAMEPPYSSVRLLTVSCSSGLSW